jgi:hypothetical protein
VVNPNYNIRFLSERNLRSCAYAIAICDREHRRDESCEINFTVIIVRDVDPELSKCTPWPESRVLTHLLYLRIGRRTNNETNHISYHAKMNMASNIA